MRLLLALLVMVTPALAETPLTADEFEAVTLGQTLTWSNGDTVFGFEQYLPGRKIRGLFADDDCMDGFWYPQGDAICFQYESDTAPVCWQIYRSGVDFLAHYTNNAPDAPPVILSVTQDAPACFGPKIGV